MKIEDENGGGREARDADEALGQDRALTLDFDVVTLGTNGLADVLDEGSARFASSICSLSWGARH
jgi:hypothetical protein